MRSIAIINQKGGVGKTTTAVNLGAGLAESGKKVCVIDMDPQSHASLHLGLALAEGDPSVYDVLTGEIRIADIRHPINDNLAVVPAHLDLAAAEMELAGEVGREIILRDKLTEDNEEFDYLILDCPPSLGVLTLNALTAVSEVFLPMQPHFLALHGFSKLLRTIEIVSRRLNPELHLTGVLLCMYDSGTRLAGEVSGDLADFFAAKQQQSSWAGARLFETKIRRNVRLAEAPSFGKSIFEYASNCNGAEDYRNLSAEVLAMEARLKRIYAAAG